MSDAAWGDPRHVLDSVRDLMSAALPEMLPTVSGIIAEFVGHRAMAMLTGDCPKSTTWSCGDPAITADVSTMELTKLATHVGVGQPWRGRALFAGAQRPVLAIASAPPNSAGALLAIVLEGDIGGALMPPDLAVLQQLWDLATTRIVELLPAAVPVNTPWIAHSERARMITNLTDAHAATLHTLLGALRSRSLDDATARRTAIDLAASAVVELRAPGDDEITASEESAREAYGRLADMLALLGRYSDVTLEFSELDHPERMLTTDIARTARTVARGTVLTMLEQGGVGRIRVSWEVDDTELRATIRDDGPGTLSAQALAVHRLTDRAAALNGVLRVDSVPEWGTIVTTRLPLAAPEVRGSDPLSTLNPRELDVLGQLVQGHRNRTIAANLHISEHTVKFHVAKILRKLDVDSRGEAAALARDSGLPQPITAELRPGSR